MSWVVGYLAIAIVTAFGSGVWIAMSLPVYNELDRKQVRSGFRGLVFCWAWPVLIGRGLAYAWREAHK
jgi:hypothetical protein